MATLSLNETAPAAPMRTFALPKRGAAVLAAAFLLAYLPTYLRLADGPWRTEQEGHGPLILAATVWLAWRRRGRLAALAAVPAPIAGWTTLLASLAVMAVARSQDLLVVEAATQVSTLLGLVLTFGGWPMARTFAFPLGFLLFSAPPPGWALDALTVPLKAWISDVVAGGLYDLGYPIAQNGVMIMIGPYELMVKDACSGMNSIAALSAVGVFYVREFAAGRPFRQVALILSILPIAVLANLLRVTALALTAYYAGVEAIEGLAHDLTGVALFVVAMAMFAALDGALVGGEVLVGRLRRIAAGVRPAAVRPASV